MFFFASLLLTPSPSSSLLAPLSDWPVFEAPLPSTSNCSENWIKQRVDHFSFASSASYFDQRYFTFSEFYKEGGPVFFYCGNEAAVDLYVNNTGLMWELGRREGALLVFAEHRYYGKSRLFEDGTKDCFRYLSVEQALADFAVLLRRVRSELSLPPSTATVAFGGSYGGMLAAWMRMKYPHLIDGAIAGSAPIFSNLGVYPDPDPYAFNKRVTRNAGVVCAKTFRKALLTIERLGGSEEGRRLLSSSVSTCSPLRTAEEAMALLDWAQEPWGNLAMGDFPYPSSYLPFAIGQGKHDLPAFPQQAACEPLTSFAENAEENMEEEELNKRLVSALDSAVNLWYNVSGTKDCTFTPAEFVNAEDKAVTSCEGNFDFQQCTEMATAMSQGGPEDMFWPQQPFSLAAYLGGCEKRFGISRELLEESTGWSALQYGVSMVDTIASMSNTVFSNGALDPWAPQGVDCRILPCPSSVVSPLLPSGAHHLDLMFSHEGDTSDVRAVRRLEAAHISSWVEEKVVRHAKFSNFDRPTVAEAEGTEVQAVLV